jgi:hypothetical protein
MCSALSAYFAVGFSGFFFVTSAISSLISSTSN